MARPDLTIFTFLFVLFMPIIVPIGLCLGYPRLRRLRAQAKTTVCEACQTILGVESLRLADTRWKTYLADLRARHPNAKFRLVRSLDAICPVCAAQYHYKEQTRSFRRISTKPRRAESGATASTRLTRDSLSES